MRFSKKSEYALRALIELTANYELSVPVQRTQLAQAQRIPLGFLEGILLTLKNAGILTSRRGVDGGFRLLKDPGEVTLGHIIRTLDGPLAPIGCVSQTAYHQCEDCPYADTSSCPIQSVMLDVRNAIAAILDHYTLEDFVRNIVGNERKKKVPKVNPMKKKRVSSKVRKPQIH